MRILAALKLILTLSCEESTRIVSDSLDRDTSSVERWAVRLHGIGCWSCRRFRRQMQFLRQAMRSREKVDTSAILADESLSAAARERMLLAIQRAEGKEPLSG